MLEDLKTVLDDSRIDEPRYEYPYPELDSEERSSKKKEKKETPAEKQEEEEEIIAKQITSSEMNKQNKILLVLAVIFTTVVIAVTCIVVLLLNWTKKEETEIPDVYKMSVKEAIDALQDAGFTVADKQEEISDSEVPEGKVVKTNPPVGAKRTKGREVTLYISTGDNQYTVEDFVGEKMHYLKAQGKLEEYEINVQIRFKEVSEEDNYEEGQIIEQSVAPGEKLGAKDTIILYIPNIEVTYPDFTSGSYTLEEVQEFCDRYGVTLKPEYEEREDVPAGAIFEQDKPKGYTVREGTTLKIKIAQAVTVEDPIDDCGGLC